MFTKRFTIICSVFLIIALAVGGGLGYYDAKFSEAVNTKKKLVKAKNEDELTFDNDVINILLVGSDHGAINGDSGRSDSMMIATVNLKTKELKLTSLLRDMYVNIPDHGHNKLNAAYAYGGVDLLYQTIADNFNIKIDHYCVVDFAAFEKVINSVGGIEMTLEEGEAHYLNTTQLISKKKYRNVKVGKQTLKRKSGTWICKDRYEDSKKYGTGEFGRTGRQRAVLQATFHKCYRKIL
jgi:LCP family protein required for cell wall assembly